MQTSREEEDEKPRSNTKQQSSPHTDSETDAARTEGQTDRWTDGWMDGWTDGWMAFLCSVIMSGVCHHSSSLQEHGLDNLHT